MGKGGYLGGSTIIGPYGRSAPIKRIEPTTNPDAADKGPGPIGSTPWVRSPRDFEAEVAAKPVAKFGGRAKRAASAQGLGAKWRRPFERKKKKPKPRWVW